MAIYDYVIEIANCLIEALIIVFYLYNLMKENYRYQNKALVLTSVCIFTALTCSTMINDSPWLRLDLLYQSVYSAVIPSSYLSPIILSYQRLIIY